MEGIIVLGLIAGVAYYQLVHKKKKSKGIGGSESGPGSDKEK